MTALRNAPYETIDAYVDRERRRLAMPGVSLAIVHGDRIVHLRGFGQARPGGEAPCPETQFFIGSLAKSFTALAVMQLVEAGQVELDAPIQRYLPWFRVADPRASAQMTLRHLLTHTSGLPNSAGEIILADSDPSPRAAERQARALSTLALARPVGSAWEYSNSNYQLLGLIIEAASGRPYADYVQQHIFAPLGMNHTCTTIAAAHNLAMGHQYWFGLPIPAPGLAVPPGALAGGGLISSAKDLAHYQIALLGNGRYRDVQIVSSASVDEMQRGAVDVRSHGLALGQYGLGWSVDQLGSTRVVWHGGTVPHFGAFMALLPEHKTGIVLLFNACHHWMTPVQAEFGLGATALLARERPAPLPIVGLIPWLLRGQALIPALQAVGVAATLRQLRRWRRAPGRRPAGARAWARHVLLPMLPNLLLALSLMPMLTRRRGYLKLYMPDFALIAWVYGGLALLWSMVHIGLALEAHSPRRRPPSPGLRR
jgi:CubicO group peptidase (beta-lactamase class C family)